MGGGPHHVRAASLRCGERGESMARPEEGDRQGRRGIPEHGVAGNPPPFPVQLRDAQYPSRALQPTRRPSATYCRLARRCKGDREEGRPDGRRGGPKEVPHSQLPAPPRPPARHRHHQVHRHQLRLYGKWGPYPIRTTHERSSLVRGMEVVGPLLAAP